MNTGTLMYMCIYIYIYIYIYICVHKLMYICIHVHICTCVYISPPWDGGAEGGREWEVDGRNF